MFYYAIDGPAHLTAILFVGYLLIWDWELDVWRGISNAILTLGSARSISISTTDCEVSVLDASGGIRSYPIPSLLPRSYSETPEIIEVSQSDVWSTSLSVQITGAYTSEQWRPADILLTSSPVVVCDYHNEFRLLANTRKDVPPVSFIETGDGDMVSLTVVGMGAWFVTMWWCDGDLIAHFNRFPAYPAVTKYGENASLENEESSHKVILSSDFGEKGRDWASDWVAHSFCPISGRVCLSLGNGTLRILEF